MRKRFRKWYALACMALVLFIAAGGYLYILIFEGIEGRRWGVVYTLLVRSDVVRGFPVLQPVDGPYYGYSVGDRGGPYNSVRYNSSIPLVDARDRLRRYLRDLGYAVEAEGRELYVKGSSRAFLRIETEADGTTYVIFEEED